VDASLQRNAHRRDRPGRALSAVALISPKRPTLPPPPLRARSARRSSGTARPVGTRRSPSVASLPSSGSRS
jgi:hypothetical protein